MKLCRYGTAGQERPGILDAHGMVRSLSDIVPEITPAQLSPERLAALAAVNVDSLPLVDADTRLGVPYVGMSKFICIGLNYIDHAIESNLPIPDEPIIFLKANSALSGPGDDIVKPRHSTKLDWEVELGVVIGSLARSVSEADALSHIAGYCVVNDVSERAFQTQSSQWDKGKGCDTFGPVGPYLVTRDDVPEPQDLDMWLEVNGQRRQTGNTSKMIFRVDQIISYVSRYMTLLPGDIIATGTPPGVGMGWKPDPVWLNVGDVVTLGIEGLGAQTQRVTSWRA